MLNKISILIACICLLVAGIAAAQTLRQVKPRFVGTAFVCIVPEDTDFFYKAITGLDSMPEAEKDQIDERWNKKVEIETCGFLKASAIFHAMRDDERYPELVGIQWSTRSGRPTGGRTYWTRKEWIEEPPW